MKKRTLIERKRALKEAYYNELKKTGVIDTPKVKTLENMTKKELIELALNNGLELDSKLTKAIMIEMINNHTNSIETFTEEETNIEFGVSIEDDGKVHVRPIEDGEVIDTPIESIEDHKIAEESEENGK